MRIASAAIVCSAALAMLAGCAADGQRRGLTALQEVSCQREPWQLADRSGHRLLTGHYDVRTTIDDPVLLDAIPQVLETAYLYYRQLIPTAEPPSQPMRVYLFARRDEWAAFTRRLAGARAATLLKVRQGGYTEGGVAVIQYVSHAVTFPLLTHEGFHQYVHDCIGRPLPAWLNEGLATLCEGQRWSSTGLREFDPWYNPARRNALAQAFMRDELIPLDELLAMNAGHVVGGPTRRIGTYYAQVWALMLFLQESGEGRYAADFQRLLSTAGSEDLRPHARAAGVRSRDGASDFGTLVFRAFITDELEAAGREYEDFIRTRLLGQQYKQSWR